MSAYRFIESEKANHRIGRLCSAVRVSRSAYYVWACGQTWTGHEDDADLVRIKAIHRRSRGTYGSPRVAAELRADGESIGRRRVARLMRENGLSGKPKRRFRGTTTDSNHDQPVAANHLARQFAVTAPNVVWAGDITYLPVDGGWVYLAVLIDLFSRKVVGWSVAETMQTELCLDALRMATVTRSIRPGLLHHTDRGSQYTSGSYRAALKRHEMVQSMSRKGNGWDNAVVESFFGTLEQELVGDTRWQSVEHARKAVGDYIHGFYNAERRHSTLGQISPVEFENLNQAA